MDDKDGPPPAKALDEGYNQTYLIMAKDGKSVEAKGDDNHEVFFRCGNWCYKGQIQFGGVNLNIDELPVLIPLLQKQQGSLRYFCNSKSVPPQSDYNEPLAFLEQACEFIAQEILSESVDKELRKMSQVFPWIDDDSAATYFELALSNVPKFMDKVSMIASKTYTRGLIIISIYFDAAIYFVMQPGEGDQALLDVRFPDVSQHGQGLHIDSYNDHTVPYRKLTLWHILSTGGTKQQKKELPKIRTLNVSTKNYQQTYCILKSSWDNNSPTLTVHHDVLFRFGSWCYSGRVQLTPSLTLADIPFVIPALRMQQSRLDYLCDVSQVPTTSPFANALAYIQKITPLVETQIQDSEETLRDLIDRLTSMGLGESVSKWIEGDPTNSFFEFKIQPDEELSEHFKNVELVVSKCYHASGIISIIIVYQHTIYVSLLENTGESPLLDSRFPDVSGKGRGYQLSAYNPGDRQDWPLLRKVSIWQTVAALEQEFQDKADQYAQSKKQDQVIVYEGAKDSENNSNGSRQASNNNLSAELDLEVAGANTRKNQEDFPADSDAKGSSSATRGTDSKNADSNPETEVPARAEAKNGSTSAPVTHRSPTPAGEKGSDVTAAPSTLASDTSSTTAAITTGLANTSISSPAATGGLRPLGGLAPLGGAGGARLSALPHHIPKDAALASRLDDIRKNMGEEGFKAPWDAKGKPLGTLGGLSPLGKESKK